MSQSQLASPLDLLQKVLPLAMLAVFLAGLGGGVRLGLYLGQPFPGFAMSWRKELDHFTVSYVTPVHWPGMVVGLQSNDRILCIDGYAPIRWQDGPAPNPAAAGIDCPYGGKAFPLAYREIARQGDTLIDIRVDRNGSILTVADVPLATFTIVELLEVYLPSFVLAAGLLTIGAVVYRANPTLEINLVFGLFTTITAALMVTVCYSIMIGSPLEYATGMTLLLMAPWLPLLGVSIFHLTGLLSTHGTLTTTARRLLPPYYLVSILFALAGILAYLFDNSALSLPLNWPYLRFVTLSTAFAVVWGFASLTWTFFRKSSRRARHQAGLVLAGLITIMALLVPFAVIFLSGSAGPSYFSSIPYLVLGLVLVLAYAILRYQLFAAHSRVLPLLTVVILCILVAVAVHLLIGQQVGVLPILAASLGAGLLLEARRGPTAFFNRLLRREVTDYQTIASFSQDIGRLQSTDDLVQAARKSLVKTLEADTVDVWLFEPDQMTLAWYHDDGSPDLISAPTGLAETLLASPDPLQAHAPEAERYAAMSARAGGTNAAVWAPLVERNQAVGLLALGPRWTGEVYDDQDLRLIGILAHQAALSILNARQLERLRASAQLVVQAEENERHKIARELHDTILQFLLVLTYGLDDLKERQPAVAVDVERWQDRISAEADRMRSLLTYLRAPELLVQQGLIASLQTWLDQVRQETTIAIDADLAPAVERMLSTEAKIAIYRVCREAVHNALKHSGGRRVVVKIWPDGKAVRFSVEDDGCGFDVDAALVGSEKGYSSLHDLRVYVESVGGCLRVRSARDEGTMITGLQPTNPVDLAANISDDRL